MKDPDHKVDKRPDDPDSSDLWSERLVLLVLAWIALVALVPLHVLVAYNVFFTGSPFALVVLFALFGIPLAAIDVFAFRWFQDNYSVFRWINRSGDESVRK